MMRMVFLGLAVSAALLASLSCGGGGDDGRDTSQDVSLAAPPLTAMDGFVYNSPPDPTVMLGSPPGIQVGDIIDMESRGFLTFDISALPPPPAVVRAAVIEVEQWFVTGNPYPSFGSVVIDHIDLGASLDSADFAAPALDSAFATVTSNQATIAYSVDVRSQIGADQIAGRSRSSFRLRFTFPGGHPVNGVTDSADFNDSNDQGGTGFIPKLTIVYSP